MKILSYSRSEPTLTFIHPIAIVSYKSYKSRTHNSCNLRKPCRNSGEGLQRSIIYRLVEVIQELSLFENEGNHLHHHHTRAEDF